MINEYVKDIRTNEKMVKICETVSIDTVSDEVPLEESVAGALILTIAKIQGTIGGAFAGASIGGKLAVMSASLGMVSPVVIIPSILIGGAGLLYAGIKFATKKANVRPSVKSDRVSLSLVDNIHKRDELIELAATEGASDSIKKDIETATKTQIRLGNELSGAITLDKKGGVISDEEFTSLRDISSAAKSGKLSYLPSKGK